MAHLSPEELLDLAENANPEAWPSHLEACAPCRERLSETQAVLRAVASVAVPEPSPLFWDHLSARISRAVAEEQLPGAISWWSGQRWRSLAMGGTAVAGVAMMALLWITAGRQRDGAVTTPSVGVASSARDEAVATDGVADDDDRSLLLLGDLVEEVDWEVIGETGSPLRGAAVDRALAELSEEDRAALQRLLTDALNEPPRGSGV